MVVKTLEGKDELPSHPGALSAYVNFQRIAQACSKKYSYSTLFCSFFCMCVTFMDRGAMQILMPFISSELKVSDTQSALLNSSFYALNALLVQLPIGVVVNVVPPAYLLCLLMFILCVGAFISSFAATFLQLAIVRFFVSIAEVGAMPVAIPLAIDSCSEAYKALVMSMMLGSNACGIALGSVIAGYCSEWFSWRSSLVLASGVPSICCGVVIHSCAGSTSSKIRKPSLEPYYSLPYTAYLLVLATGFLAQLFWPPLVWWPTFLSRYSSLSISQIGNVMFVVNIVAVPLGSVFGGLCGYMLQRNTNSVQSGLILSLLFSILSCVPFLSILTTDLFLLTQYQIMFLLSSFHLILQTSLPLLLTPAFKLAGAASRGVIFALHGFFGNLIGQLLGSSVVGIISDSLSTTHGHQSLRLAMAPVYACGIVGVSLCIAVAAKRI